MSAPHLAALLGLRVLGLLSQLVGGDRNPSNKRRLTRWKQPAVSGRCRTKSGESLADPEPPPASREDAQRSRHRERDISSGAQHQASRSLRFVLPEDGASPVNIGPEYAAPTDNGDEGQNQARRRARPQTPALRPSTQHGRARLPTVATAASGLPRPLNRREDPMT